MRATEAPESEAAAAAPEPGVAAGEIGVAVTRREVAHGVADQEGVESQNGVAARNSVETETGTAAEHSTGTGSGTEAGSGVATIEGHIGVRTAFSRCLAPIAHRWIRGAVSRPPEDFVLTAPMLRLWYIAAGHPVGPPGRPAQAVVLRLAPTRQSGWRSVGAALRRAGLPASLVGPRGGGPAYRIFGRRRVARFAEIIGAPPDTAPLQAWPRVVSSPLPSGISDGKQPTSRTIPLV